MHVGDRVVLEHVESGMALSLGRLSDGRGMYEVIGTAAEGSSFKLMRYHRHSVAANLLSSGLAVHIFDKEAQGSIGVEHGSSSVSVLEADSSSKGLKSSNGIFVLERLSAADGRPCLWHDQFRIRHLATGRLLCLQTTPQDGDSAIAQALTEKSDAKPHSGKGLHGEDGDKGGDAAANAPYSEVRNKTHGRVEGTTGAESDDATIELGKSEDTTELQL